jgi:hypothetical protein
VRYFVVKAEQESVLDERTKFCPSDDVPRPDQYPPRRYSGRPVITIICTSFIGLSPVRMSPSNVADDRVLQTEIFADGVRVLPCAALEPVTLWKLGSANGNRTRI